MKCTACIRQALSTNTGAARQAVNILISVALHRVEHVPLSPLSHSVHDTQRVCV